MYDRAPRLLRLTEGGSTEDCVGPGSYQVPFLKQQATGGYAPFLSLATRESSFTTGSNTEKAAPGPGHYNVSKAQKISRAPTASRTVDVPSIPSCGQAYGYHINEDDTIIKRFPPAHDSTLGPAYYKPQYNVFNAALKYKGIHFGNSLGRRELPPKSGPGPGQYDIVQEKPPQYENINIKKERQQNYCSFIPRFYDSVILQEEKKRFVPMKSITPAPGTYNEPRTALKSLKKTLGLKKSAFGQSAARFTQESRTEEMPGPGFYNILNSTIVDNVKNICLEKKGKSAFGSSVPRTFFLVQKETLITPGPADYQAFWNSQVSGSPDKLPNLTNQYAAFLSRTERTNKLLNTGIPPPGSYDVQKSYDMSQGKQKYMPPRSLVAKRKQSSFLSGTPRCWEKMTAGPGPATYNPILKKSYTIPLFVKTSKRFEDSKETTPGPATYEVCK
ncbi:sperm-tail PG-rich repeat-containing protein 2 [Elephas maximus indicus]|uniref:sperm-tail PG-rich repeat-containing protein 2 n=1 Tax=Elephas maximus indicus TaxID=99487 RepID=UPI0021167639|nr:sperm-tail PG-rich repeat-containing protein 2 [Elephas maximus indicus]